ncbi:hypothetical protein ACVWXL_008151 [Bradyrhizobium sp. GM22.5]
MTLPSAEVDDRRADRATFRPVISIPEEHRGRPERIPSRRSLRFPFLDGPRQLDELVGDAQSSLLVEGADRLLRLSAAFLRAFAESIGLGGHGVRKRSPGGGKPRPHSCRRWRKPSGGQTFPRPRTSLSAGRKPRPRSTSSFFCERQSRRRGHRGVVPRGHRPGRPQAVAEVVFHASDLPAALGAWSGAAALRPSERDLGPHPGWAEPIWVEKTVNHLFFRYSWRALPLFCGCPGLTGSSQFRAEMFQDTADLAALAEVLSQSTDYRVLRRLVPRAMCPPDIGQETKVGILIDTETTGLDHARDEVIELGMVKFDYLRPAGSSASGTRSPPSTSRPRPSRPRLRRSRASPAKWWPATGPTRRP